MTRAIFRIRIVSFFLLSTAIFTGAVRGSEPGVSAQFDAANRLYEQGRFAEAAAAYKSILDSGVESPALFFNFGNAHFKAGELGRAISAYRVAARMAPRDPDIRANLAFARSKVQGPTLPTDLRQQWLARLTLDEWAILSAVVFWIWLLALALIRIRAPGRTGFRAIRYGGAAILLLLAASLFTAARMASDTIAVVTASSASVRNGPFEESPVAFTVHDGAEIRVLDRKDNWLQVTTGSQRVGWIPDHDALLPGELIKDRTSREANARDAR